MGLENLIHAMKDVVSRVENVSLLVGGSGPLKEKLVVLVRKLGLENHIHFTGFIPRSLQILLARLSSISVCLGTDKCLF